MIADNGPRAWLMAGRAPGKTLVETACRGSRAWLMLREELVTTVEGTLQEGF